MATNNIHILLVDDEQDFLETTNKRLTRRGYAIKAATTCAAAQQEIEEGWPHVVILDVMLPDKNGLIFLKEIKHAWPSLIVILLTGHASMEAGLKSIEYGAQDYCLKPVEFEELHEKIKIALREAQIVF
ncbi:MAG: response regulator [Proteobacteria bacterium]|nr:response regulator [Desulfobulbaceae bacterium]MBU4152821.1 response regulator [Pseudomonadota bacterium]MDP2107171.1 response regulator [Desulfobulbaceae bacterium]